MNRAYAILFCLAISLAANGQRMQEFNQAYAEKRHATRGSTYNQSDSTKKAEPINLVNTIPGFTSLLGKNVLLPQIEINGLTNFSTENFYGDVRAFTSAAALKSFSNLSLFFPESSIYGLSMSFNWLPEFVKKNGDAQKIKWFCAYVNAGYFGKNLQGISANKDNSQKSDTTRFSTDVAHVKLGVQLIPIANVVSFYTDLNFVLPVVNRDPLMKYNPAIKWGSNNFWNVGTKFFLAVGKENPTKLFLDFSAVVVSKQVRNMYQTNDPIIPRLSIGGSTTF